MNKLKETKILGFPLWMYLIFSILMMVMAANDWMLTNMVGALAFAMIIGTLLGWVGDHIPVWKTWFGGGMLFSCLVAGAMNTFHLIGEGSMEALNTFNGSTGFLDLYILVLITGSVLSVDRKMLIKSFAGFVPTILAGIAGALGLAGLVGAITGVGAIEAIATYAIPVMGGGNGAGITPMSKMWAAATGGDASSWYASAFAIISIGNLCAVFMSALLNKLGQIKPSMTGNGRLMVGEENVSTKSSDVKLTAADYATGLALGVVCFNVANLYAKHISIINHANLGFSIHTFAFMVILMAILNMTNKQRFISQIMTSKSPVRSCEDVDEQALSYAEIKALCAGNPLIKEKMDLDVQVAKLKVLKADHQSQKFRLQDKLLTKFPTDIQETNAHIAGLKADAQLAADHPQGKEEFCGMTIKGVTYDEKKTAGERLVLACSELPNAEEKVIGSYRGFELSLRFDTFRSEYQALLKGQRKYTVPLGTDPLGNIIRLDNSLNNFPERITAAENELDTLHQQQAAAQIEVEKPFPQEEELAEKSARLAELNAQLDVDEKSHEPEQDEEEQEDPPRRPSVLAALEEKSDKPEPVKPFRSYYDKDGDAR